MSPLKGLRVLDFSSLLPGPLASLFLAEAGADVVRIEKPPLGDDLRRNEPLFGPASASYAVLNRGKRAYVADMKDVSERAKVLTLAGKADVIIEQFRPGVIDRLGLGYDEVYSRNPRVVYCSITGYGPDGNFSDRAGHDLTYLAESGLLGLSVGSNGSPTLPPTVIADIAGGSYPALVNILLALLQRDVTNRGTHLKVSLTHNLQVMSYSYFAKYQVTSRAPAPNMEKLTGASPRYQIYGTLDGRWLAVAALEQKFWDRLVDLIDLPEKFRDERGQERSVIDAMREIFSSKSASYWKSHLTGEDVCAVVVATWEEAVAAGLISVENVGKVSVPGGDKSISTLRLPISEEFTVPDSTLPYPSLMTLEGNLPW